MFGLDTVQRIKAEVMHILEAFGAIVRDDHFVYKSGNHGSVFVNKDQALINPIACERIANVMASSLVNIGDLRPEVLIGMAEGSINLAGITARLISSYYSRNGDVLGMWASKDAQGQFYLRSTMEELIRGKTVVIIEDVTTTGSSIRELATLLARYQCKILGAGIMVNRGNVKAKQVGVPKLISLLEMPEEAYPADKCPLCKKGVPINTKLGHGKEFVAKQAEKQ